MFIKRAQQQQGRQDALRSYPLLTHSTLPPSTRSPTSTSFSPFERTQIDFRTAQIRLFPSICRAWPTFLIALMSLFFRSLRTLITFPQPSGSEWLYQRVRSPANNTGSSEEWGRLKELLLDSLSAICDLFSFS